MFPATRDWLLEESNPSVRYRTLVELLGENPASKRAHEARRQIEGCKAVRRILSLMHPDGYWLQSNPRSGVTVGEGVEYGTYATTHFCLAYLAELGMDKSHPQVEKAADRYLNLQKPDGDFWNHLSCLNGYNIRNFILLGYGEDPRLQNTIELMLATDRWDKGYLCDLHERHRKNKKSCARGSGKMLLAFAMLPDLWKHERCRALVDYFLRRGIIFRQGEPGDYVTTDITRLTFPFVWRISVLELLWALSKMGLGGHDATREAWSVLEEKRTDEDRYILDWNPAQAPLNTGKRGQPNKWITFYALQAKQYRDAELAKEEGS